MKEIDPQYELDGMTLYHKEPEMVQKMRDFLEANYGVFSKTDDFSQPYPADIDDTFRKAFEVLGGLNTNKGEEKI